jgi:multiple sugar transport system permease protein
VLQQPRFERKEATMTKQLMMKKFIQNNSGILYVLPSFLILLIFSLIPLFMTGYISFTKYNVMQPSQWIGLNNYIAMMKDPFFLPAIKNTIVYTLLTVPIQTILALLIAFVLANVFNKKFGNFIKSALFIPVISSSILVGTVWKFMFATESGIINQILGMMGVSKINWLGEYTLALVSVCIVAIWKNVGYFLVIYYAGIMDIPRSHFEAAQVDGATKWQQLLYITIPALKPITYLVITLGTIWSFQVFDLVYTMTGGGPGTATITMVMSIYQTGFKQYKMGYASAMSFILFLIIIAVSILQKRLFNDASDKRRKTL